MKTMRLLTATSVLALSLVAPLHAQDCSLIGDVLPAGCEAGNAGLAVTMPAGANTETDRGTAQEAPEGFLITIDGAPLSGDARVEDLARRADKALSKADLRVQFDGLGAKPRLDLDVLGDVVTPRAGQGITVQSRLNYPAYVTRGEVRIIDRAARGGPRTIATYPIAPNGQTTITLPQGEDLVITHRVYDARGRYDETAPLSLMRPDDRPLTDDVEEGTDRTVRRRIPVTGGAVTVSGQGVRAGASVQTLGETIRPDASGAFVLQRILPAGDHGIDVRVQGAGENSYIQRDITIPNSDWFYVATADLTFGRRMPQGAPAENYTVGRLAYYAKGKTAKGWTITSSADTGEEELRDLFRNFDKKDPYNVLLRMDPDKAYPVYGDDSELEQDAPTNGKFYLKAEKNGSHLMWGNYTAQLKGGTYLRNERTLYGFQGVYTSQAATSRGQAKVEATLYAAQPDMLPGRDIFRGTGGSVYFLKRQDLSIGSETVSIEVRDRDTGRVVETRTLVYGRDYDINYTQGLVTLSAPLTGQTGSGTIITTPGGAYDVRLNVQYEYTPTATDVEGFTYGGRAQAWVTDTLRVGVTGMVEQTGTADQTAWGADLRWEYSEGTYVTADYARSKGPGFGSSYSDDGGLIITNSAAASGTGEAWALAGQAELTDLGFATEGTIAAYYEKRTAGFNTLDYQTSVNEQLWGISAEVRATDRLTWKLTYDDFEDAAGKRIKDGGGELRYATSDTVTWSLGLEHTDRNDSTDPTQTGKRTDIGLRVDVTASDSLKWYLFGQHTVNRAGGLVRNDRVGAGAILKFSDHWTAEAEISDGSQGVGGKALFTYSRDAQNSTYVGYSLDPGRTFDTILLNGRDRGQWVAGGRRQVSEDVSLVAENTYDMFGAHNALTSAYGVEYARSSFLTYSANFEYGQIDDTIAGDFTRKALSFGVRYQNEQGLTARARLELRRDRGVTGGTNRDADTVLLVANAAYKISEEKRLLFSFDGASTNTDGSSVLSGDYAEVTFGYAFRPIENDRLNMLFKYTYLYDMYGQLVDGSSTPGPRQRSHVLSFDVDYDLNPHWTVGGKLGLRWSDSAPDSTTPLARNNAALAVINARYHLTHKWDLLLEGRYLTAQQAGLDEFSVLGAAYRHVGNNLKIGVGYNFGSFSDDLTDLTYDDKGVFINLIAKF